MIWFTADTHYGHENINKYCRRGFKNANHMDSVLIEHYNYLVKPEDICYFLGDFTMYGPNNSDKIEAYLRKLNGIKILILGNHDRCKPFQYVDMGFQSVHTSLDFSEFLLTHDPAIATCVPNSPVLCGHIHTIAKQFGNCYNVGVDIHNFFPISYETVRNSFEWSSCIVP